MLRSRIVAAALTSLALGAAVVVMPGPAADAVEAACQGRPATIVGEPGTPVEGTDGDDVIVTNGTLAIHAGAGDDLVCVTVGPRTDVDAGAGDDQVYVTDGRVEARLGLGEDVFVGGSGDDVVGGNDVSSSGDAEHDVIDAGAGDDRVYVGDRAAPLEDEVHLGEGVDSVSASGSGAGTQAVLDGGGQQGDYLGYLPASGDGAWDVDNASRQASVDGQARLTWTGFTGFGWGVPFDFHGTDADESVYGVLRSVDLGAGDDTATGLVDGVDPGSGDVRGGGGADALRWTNGWLRLTDEPMRIDLAGLVTVGDQVTDYSGFEQVSVENNSDASQTTVRGTDGDDEVTVTACLLDLRAGPGDDTVTEISADSIDVCSWRDNVVRIRTGPGDDQVRTGLARETVELGPGDDVAFTERSADRISGGPGADRVNSGQGADRLHGDAGADSLVGSSGKDQLVGGSGPDRLDGGNGRDRCVGEVRRHCER